MVGDDCGEFGVLLEDLMDDSGVGSGEKVVFLDFTFQEWPERRFGSLDELRAGVGGDYFQEQPGRAARFGEFE